MKIAMRALRAHDLANAIWEKFPALVIEVNILFVGLLLMGASPVTGLYIFVGLAIVGALEAGLLLVSWLAMRLAGFTEVELERMNL